MPYQIRCQADRGNLPPTERQVSAIANQARWPGASSAVPSTRAGASAIIQANAAMIVSFRMGGGKPAGDREFATINHLERLLGRHWATGPSTVNSPKTVAEASKYIRQLIEELTRRNGAA